jgi:hypothetical protein
MDNNLSATIEQQFSTQFGQRAEKVEEKVFHLSAVELPIPQAVLAAKVSQWDLRLRASVRT